MKLKAYLFLFFSLLATTFFAQNLVNNPSFEEHDCSKVDGIGNFFFQQACLKWTTPTWFSGYYTSFCPDLNGNNRQYSGYQAPRTGQSFVGINISNRVTQDYGLRYQAGRMYIATRLKQTLKKDSIYQLELFVNQQNDHCRFEVELQALFSDTIQYLKARLGEEFLPPPLYPHNASLSLTPDFFVSDTIGWTRVCAMYKAKGGEKWMTIGNFDDDAHLKYRLNNRTYPLGTYEGATVYFIDDVSLTPIQNPPFIDFNLGHDTIRCDAQNPYLLAVPAGMDSYLWNTGSTNNSINVNNDGKYWVLAHDDGCTMNDTVTVKFKNTPPPFSIPTQRYCTTQLPTLYTLPLSVQNQYQSFVWSDATNKHYISITNSGIYTVTATSECNVFSTTFEVFTKDPIPQKNQDTAICSSNFPITIRTSTGFDYYLWNTNAGTQSITITQPGTYIVKGMLQECGTVSDTIIVRLRQPPLPLHLADTLLCTTDFPIRYAIPQVFTNIKWNDNTTDNPKTVAQSGIYTVAADWQCGTVRDTFRVVSESPLPPIRLLTQDTTSCTKGRFVPFRLYAPYGYPNYMEYRATTRVARTCPRRIYPP
jgi:hypothetical protein